MKWFLDVLRGAVIGLANVIPGVSGGTMMVSMGIYDKLIYSINNLFKKFKECFKILLPYLLGMVVAIVIGAFTLKKAFADYPLPTNALFIGLILGSVPAILHEMKSDPKKTWRAPFGVIWFVLFFAVVVVLKLLDANNTAALGTGVLDMIKYLALGMIASSTMVIPGVSGSMILKTLGYYEPIVTTTLPNLLTGLTGGDWAAVGHSLLILLPFGIGIVLGILLIARIIAALMAKWKGATYCAILGMVAASPVVILMDPALYAGGLGWGIILAAVICFALGFLVAIRLSGDREAPAPADKA